MLVRALLSGWIATQAVGGAPPSPAPEPAIELAFEPCAADRPAAFTGVGDLVALLAAGPRRERLVRKATLHDAGRDVTLYLPELAAGAAYRRENRGDDSTALENQSTLLSIDDDGDGVLTEREGWHASLPLRIGDAMFDVVDLAADGSRMRLARSAAPLSGIVLGRRVPEFEFKTADGQAFSNASLAGKPFVLDLWSIT